MASNNEEVESLKSKGNSYFIKGDIPNALQSYSEALDRLKNEDIILQTTILSNRAACYLRLCADLESSGSEDNDQNKLDFTEKCIEDCTRALEGLNSMPSSEDSDLTKKMSSLRGKLFYRRAKAHSYYDDSPHLNNGAKDLVELLSFDAKNAPATALLRYIRNKHSRSELEKETALSLALASLSKDEEDAKKSSSDEGDHRLRNLKMIYNMVSQDVAVSSMDIGRQKKHGIPLLLSIASDKERLEINESNAKCRAISLQILSACCSHVPFVQKYHRDIRLSDLATVVTESCPHDPDVVISTIAVVLRLVLTLDDDVSMDNASICQICMTTFTGFAGDDTDARPTSAALDLLNAWTSTGREAILTAAEHVDHTYLENTQQDLFYKQKASPKKTEEEIQKLSPRELSAYRQKERQAMNFRKKRACDNAVLFCHEETGGLEILLNCAISTKDHRRRRDVGVMIGRLFGVMVLDEDKDETVGEERIRELVLPIYRNGDGEERNKEEEEEKDRGFYIEEITEEEDQMDSLEEQNQNNDSISKTAPLPSSEKPILLKTIMTKGQLTASLFLGNPNLGAWALETGWFSLSQLHTLIASNNHAAMSIASEILSASASTEKGRPLITPLVEDKLLIEGLLTCKDSDVRSGAASMMAKLGLASKAVSHDEGEIMGLLQLAADLLEDSKDGDTATERGIELLSYLCSKTNVKEEIAHGFHSSKTTSTTLVKLVELSSRPDAGESISAYGLASIFASIAVSIKTLRREAFQGKDITPEQYQELQNLTKTQEEKDLAKEDEKEEEDEEGAVSMRIQKMAQANVPQAIVKLMDGASETTTEQLVLAMMRMAVEVSTRGIMVQQGCLSACLNIEKGESPSEIGKKITTNARHCIAKMLVTTNPNLLTTAQRMGSIHPLIQLVRDIHASDLAQFEALLSITNLASVGDETKNRIVAEKGISTLNYAMFSDHNMVRRAATEAMSNLVPHESMMAHLSDPDKLKLWLAFSSDFEENFECARAAAGCLAMASQEERISVGLAKLPHFAEDTRSCLECGNLELMHRTFVIFLNMLGHGGVSRQAVEKSGAMQFFRAYAASYGGVVSKEKEELDFGEQDLQLMEITIGLAQEIVSKYG